MPTYIYRCDNGHEVEKFEPMSAPTVQVCPQCEAGDGEDHASLTMTRQFASNAGGFSFKGGAPTRRFHRRG